MNHVPDDRFPCLDREITQAAFADLVGTTPPAITSLKQRGILDPCATAATWLHAYLRHLRATAAGWKTDGSLTEAKIREANAKAFKAEVETGKELGLLVYRADVELQLRAWAARGKQSIEAAERRIVDGIESEYGIRLESRHVADHLTDAQREIAAYPSQSDQDPHATVSPITTEAQP